MAMTEPSQSFGPGAAPSGAAAALPPSETVRVWDPFVRLFHWSLVGLVAVSFATGDEFERMHIATGYGVAGLVVLRLVWGVFGSRHARFGDFVRGPRTTGSACLLYPSDAAAERSRVDLGGRRIIKKKK